MALHVSHQWEEEEGEESGSCRKGKVRRERDLLFSSSGGSPFSPAMDQRWTAGGRGGARFDNWKQQIKFGRPLQAR